MNFILEALFRINWSFRFILLAIATVSPAGHRAVPSPSCYETLAARASQKNGCLFPSSYLFTQFIGVIVSRQQAHVGTPRIHNINSPGNHNGAFFFHSNGCKTEEDKMKLRHRSWNRYELNTNLLSHKNDEWNMTIVCGRITTRLNLVEHLWLITIAKRCEQFQMCASALCFDGLHIFF